MIQASELRIGNWVTYNPKSVDEGTQIVPLQITAIDKEAGVLLDDGFDNTYLFDEILPIPLSPMTLESCGFKWSIFHQAWHNEELDFDVSERHPEGYTVHSFKRGFIIVEVVHYLHTFQNIVHALTGQELKIEL